MPTDAFTRPQDRMYTRSPAREIPSSAWELYTASEEAARLTMLSTSRRYAQSHAIAALDLDSRYLKLTGENFPVLEDDIPGAFERARQLDPGFPEYEDYLHRRNTYVQAAQIRAQRAQQYTTTDWPTAISMLGGFRAATKDPLVLASTLVAPASFLGTLATGAAMEVPIQAMVYQWHKDFGGEYTAKDAAANVAFAGLVPAGIYGTFAMGAKLLSQSTSYVRHVSRLSNNATPYNPDDLVPPPPPDPPKQPPPPPPKQPPPKAGPEPEAGPGPKAGPAPEPEVDTGPYAGVSREYLWQTMFDLRRRIMANMARTDDPFAAKWIADDLDELRNIATVLRQSSRVGVRIPETQLKFEVQYEVVELKDLITSDMEGFDQALQPRDRSGAGKQESDDQIREIVRDFDPELLLADVYTDRGAPIIGYTNNMVESGNGRVMALRKLSPEQRAAYRKTVAKFLGYEPEGDMPVLVRRRADPLTDDEMKLYTQNSNKSTSARPNALVELDMENIPIDILRSYRPGDVTAGQNAGFVQKFLSYLKATTKGAYSTGGKLSPTGKSNIELYLMKAAYGEVEGGQELLLALMEAKSAAPVIQGILTTMRNVAGELAALRLRVRGTDLEHLDITADLVRAAYIARKAKSSSDPEKTLETLLGTTDMLGRRPEVDALARLSMSMDSVTFRKVLFDYMTAANKVVSQPAADIFSFTPTGEELLRGIADSFKRSAARMGGKKAEGEAVGGGNGAARAGEAGPETEGVIPPAPKPAGTTEESLTHTENFNKVMEWLETGEGESPFTADLGKNLEFLRYIQNQVDELGDAAPATGKGMDDSPPEKSNLSSKEQAEQEVMPSANDVEGFAERAADLKEQIETLIKCAKP